jgi:hypothetical protein
LYSLSQIYTANSHEWCNNIDKRCLIIHGKRDSLIPVDRAALLAKEISRCEFVALEDANHILVLNNVAEVGQAIERFIDNELDTPARSERHCNVRSPPCKIRAMCSWIAQRRRRPGAWNEFELLSDTQYFCPVGNGR